MDADNKTVIDEEAIAEEEFVADLEDTIENPLVYDGEKITVQEKPEQLIVEEKEELTGAIGTGDLTPEGEPFNNEEALRSESVNNDENPFGVDSGSEKAFGGPETAPLDNATETIVPSAAPEAGSGDSFGVADTGAGTPGVTDFSASGPSAMASTSEPTIEQLVNAAAGAPQTTEEPVNQTPVAATTAPAATNEPKKKSKKGLIIGIVVAVLLLAAIIGGVVFYILHESKDRVLADAISGIWSSEARQFDGKITMTPSDEAKSASMKSVTVNFKGDSKAANFSGSGDLSIEFKEGDPLNIGLSGAYISGDGIFVKIDKLEEAIKKINLGAAIGMDGDDDTADYVKLVEKVLAAVAKKIDGTWYKINADTFGSDEKIKESYQCMTKAIEEMSSKEVKDKIADIYKAHPFIEFADKDNESADGLTYYYVKVNEDESKAFGTDVKELNVFKDLQACSSSNGDMAPSGSGTAEKKEEKAEADIKLGIKGWSHELKAIKGTVSYDDTKLEMDVKMSYDNKDVTAPAGDATNIADAGADLLNAAADAYKEGYTEIAKKYCKSATTNDRDYKSCYNMMEKQLDRSLQSLLGDLGGNIINTSALLED